MNNTQKTPTTRTLEDILKELKEHCLLNSLPFFLCVATETRKEVKYISDGIMPASMNLELEDDKITRLNKVLFEDIPTIIESGNDIYEEIEWNS